MTKQRSIQSVKIWKMCWIACCALGGGFLLSFLGFGLLWSGIAWMFQIAMFVPFMLLSYAIFRWSGGGIGLCVLILVGAAPLGALMVQFRDTTGSNLLTTLMTACWVIGVLAGCYLGKSFGSPPAVQSDGNAPASDS
ncbi:MAG: lysophosphatidic acid receptor [Nitrosomonas sp.]|nr:MAG: lysophosphatidic acid receptor [Nitrosomonas sp.]